MSKLYELESGEQFYLDGKLYKIERVLAVTSEVRQIGGREWWKMCHNTEVEKR